MAKKLRAIIQFNIIENALDYFLEASRHIEKDTPRDWKYALVHCAAAVELLHKARLQMEHWSLIYRDIDKASAQTLRSGDFVSVDPAAAIERLQKIVGLSFEKKEIARLEELRKLRNRIQHYGIEIDKETLLPIIAYALHNSINFVEKELNRGITVELRSMLSEATEKLKKYQEFIDVRMADLEKELEKVESVVECPMCYQAALVLGDGEPKCLFCGYRDTAEAVAGAIGDGDPEDSVQRCPHCGGPCIRPTLETPHNWVCCSCGICGEYDVCLRCGALFEIDGEMTVCEDCLNEAIARD